MKYCCPGLTYGFAAGKCSVCPAGTCGSASGVTLCVIFRSAVWNVRITRRPHFAFALCKTSVHRRFNYSSFGMRRNEHQRRNGQTNVPTAHPSHCLLPGGCCLPLCQDHGCRAHGNMLLLPSVSLRAARSELGFRSLGGTK